MKVRLLQYISGNDRRYDVGEECDLPDAVATRWIDAGFAEAVSERRSRADDAEADEPEAAALAEAPERATLPKAGKRG
jgi:hypothetical protein